MIDPDKLLQEVLKLPADATAEFASRLLESLDEPVDQDVEAAWAEEVDRRAREVDAGRVQLLSWEEARRRIYEQSDDQR